MARWLFHGDSERGLAGNEARKVRQSMKAIHPKYKPVVVTCVGCGTKIETRSTKARDFTVDVCSHCHPFYTGRQKFVDSAGRVERFQRKWGKKEAKAEVTGDAAAEVKAAAQPQSAPQAEKQ